MMKQQDTLHTLPVFIIHNMHFRFIQL